jgi:hypothetical protein
MKSLPYLIIACGMAALLIGSVGSLFQMYDHRAWKDSIKPETDRLLEQYDTDGNGRLSTMERTLMGLEEGKVVFEYIPSPVVLILSYVTQVFALLTILFMGIHAWIHRDELRAWVKERMVNQDG